MYFVFNRRNKLTQIWNNLRVNKLRLNFYFWVNYPFKHNFDIVLMFTDSFH